MFINIFSPIFYIFFVKIIKYFPICPKSKTMLTFRKTHNIILSILSLIMFILIIFETWWSGKFNTINNLLCLPYKNNTRINYIANIFLYSKYIEWLDTLFLHLSGKKISSLQYTHI